MIARREVLACGAVAAALALAPSAEACSIVATRRGRFSDRACRAALQAWVDLLNRGPQMSPEQIEEAEGQISVEIDEQMIDEVASDQLTSGDERRQAFYKQFRLSDGRLDTRPIRIEEMILVRQLRNRAAYQFTLERYSYHPADPEGCNGMFVHDEYWGLDRTSYLATFENNRLQTVKLFPEWFLEEERG